MKMPTQVSDNSTTDVTTAPETDRDELLPEYDFSKGVRGLTAQRRRARAVSFSVTLAPDVAQAFPTEEAVNEALRGLLAAREEAAVTAANNGGGAS